MGIIYISIGFKCNVKFQINKHKHKIETLFFDWLITSMKSVIEVLSCNDISNILNIDNIIRDPRCMYHNNNSRIFLKSLNYCISIHDLKKEFNNDDIFEFIEKYRRRYNRIIEHIKSDRKLCFLKYGSVNEELQNKFIETILKINPKCNFHLVIIDNNKSNVNSITKSDHKLYIKLNVENPAISDWTTSYLN